MNNRKLDVICIGRSSVDLYGEQVGGRLEDMQSFAKYVGGCATNIAVGTSRLGLKSGLITRVGDEQMGRYIADTLQSEGVDISNLTIDPERLTALVILGIRDLQTSPHIFYRENCADMAISTNEIDQAYIASSKSIVVTGTHFSQPGVEAASRLAIKYAKQAGTKVVLDIDYRPVAWGLTSHGDGENRFIESADISAHVQTIIADCDLIVGTEEEIHIAGGSTDTMQAVKKLRAINPDAAIVVKRGPMGCVVFPGAIPENLDDGIWVKGKEIEVYNTLGAGDGFMSGFLRGWVANEDWKTCCEYGNASGAIVVSRHGCAPAIPSWVELQDFLQNGSPHFRLRDDKRLAHIHRVTNRKKQWPEIRAIAFDHRSQFEHLLENSQKTTADIGYFKSLIAQAAGTVLGADSGIEVLVDDKYGFDTMANLTNGKNWVARPVELPGSRPLEFEAGNNIAATLHDWPESHIAKCLVSYSSNDETAMKQQQIKLIQNLYAACLSTNHEMLLEVIPPQPCDDDDIISAMQDCYEAGIYPDWWKISPLKTAKAWQQATDLIKRFDPHCRGVVMLGLNAPIAQLLKDFEIGAKAPICKGFAVGRSVFAEAAEKWFNSQISDAQAMDLIAEKYAELISSWRLLRS
ncbi:MAG: 5-dehydro-2-deoxygluconokinase [Rhizobiales bacterium]|nr:5-dehydro-2-deoxygluconokinase [Hyphomicrobiales bacterium]NRB15603.1 5-dehydro-2-deoxygluconokinase [Hyphomicrobiales bacterium]